jgi:CBS domain containing-hemolysin-like protein
MKTSRQFARAALLAVALSTAAPAHASLFSGDTLDLVADILAWIVLIVAPVIAITVFWLVHILPEKIAEKRHHPQATAIKTLCLLSLFFGGLLWPLAWLWAYSRPVLYKMAYGVDEVKHGHAEEAAAEAAAAATSESTVAEVAEPEAAAATPAASRNPRAANRERRPWEA